MVNQCGVLWRTWTVQVLWDPLITEHRELLLQRHSASILQECDPLWSYFLLGIGTRYFPDLWLLSMLPNPRNFPREKASTVCMAAALLSFLW